MLRVSTIWLLSMSVFSAKVVYLMFISLQAGFKMIMIAVMIILDFSIVQSFTVTIMDVVQVDYNYKHGASNSKLWWV